MKRYTITWFSSLSDLTKSPNKPILVGGTGGYFPDEAQAGNGKPWSNKAESAMSDFYHAKVNLMLLLIDWLLQW